MTRTQYLRWQQSLKLAQEMKDKGLQSLTLDVDILLAVERYIAGLNKQVLDLMSKGLDAWTAMRLEAANEPKPKINIQCTHCGLEIGEDDSLALDMHGRYHIWCHGEAERERRRTKFQEENDGA
jgi:hypothetical protein